ncbi:MAG: DUF4910 domain-containing protein [Candidatus Omnitrophota bacterium]
MIYNHNDIVISLKKSGIKNGDTVFFTTSLGMVGVPPSSVNTQEKLDKLFFDAIKEVLGKEGTALVPAYSYTFGKSTITNPVVFDPRTTQSQIGPFANFFLKQSGVIRSLEPMMSIAGFGPRAKEFLENLPPTSYGEGSVFSRLVKSDAKCCSIGLGPNWVPFIHYAEWLYQVPFRYDKFFHGLISINKKTKPFSWVYAVRILAKEAIANAHKVGRLAEEAGIWQHALLGRARVYTANCREYFNFICDRLEKDRWLLATGPAGDTFELEKKRVDVELTKVSLSKFDPILWLKILSALRRDVVSENIDAVFEAISKYFPISFNYWPSGSHSLGWIVPEKWQCRDALISTLQDKIVFAYDSNPNFVRSYSKSVDEEVSREELLKHVNTQLNMAPFNYRDWGFCLPKPAVRQLTQRRYRVRIQTDFYYGKMRTGELFLKGTTGKTVVIASYLDGPDKVNESLSGLVVSLSLYQWLKNKDRNLNYIFLLLPGKVGFSSWLSNRYDKLRQPMGIIHFKWLGLPFKPILFSFNKSNSLIVKAAKSVIGRGSVKIKSSLFLSFCGKDNPLSKKFNINIPQYMFCKVDSSSNPGDFLCGQQKADDIKITPQSIENSIKISQNFINQLEENALILSKKQVKYI